MTRLLLAICAALALTLCLSAVASAHKVNIFAYVDGNSIVTDSGYSRTRRVTDGLVEVYDAKTNLLLLSGKTDKTGRFDFPIPAEALAEKMDLRLLLKAGEGHQAKWTVHYSEYATAKGPFTHTQKAHTHETVAPSDAGKSTVQPICTAEIKAVVSRELAPMKRMLAEMHDSGPGVTEIVGGIGYIIGLFGIAAYMKSRKSG